MTKTVCDICGKEMPSIIKADTIENHEFCISSYGEIWNMCTECRESFNKWITVRSRKRNKDVENE